MANHKLLNNIEHQDLKIIVEPKKEFGDDVAGSLIFPAEFSQAHKEFPIYFQKDAETGAFQAITLFGFKQAENLFLSDEGWQAHYLPALIRREPFLIGFQRDHATAEDTPVVHVDMDSPRISKGDTGQSVFLENGGNTAYLQEITSLLLMIHGGMDHAAAMFEAFLAHDLIEPFSLEIEFDNGELFKTDSYYTIHQEKLFSLDDKALGELHRSGFLQCAYRVVDSMSNVRLLIDKKNAAK